MSALRGKGYVATDGRADLAITVRSEQRSVTVQPLGTVDSDPGEEPAMRSGELVESTIAIDAFDASSHARVWHGTDRVRVRGDVFDARQREIAVERLLASFPTSALQRALEPSVRPQAALDAIR